MQYAQTKADEAQKWESAYNQEKAKNDYLTALLEQYGIPIPDFSNGIPLVEVKTGNTSKKEKTFRDMIQTEDVDGTLAKLHLRIDGHGGKDVAMVLHRAKSDSLICRFPTEKEFKSEFPNFTGAWRSISYYLNPNTAIDFSSVTI